MQKNFISLKDHEGHVSGLFSDSILLGFFFDKEKRTANFITEEGVLVSIINHEKDFKKAIKTLTNKLYKNSCLQTQYHGFECYVLLDKISHAVAFNDKTKLSFLNSNQIVFLDENITSFSNKI